MRGKRRFPTGANSRAIIQELKSSPTTTDHGEIDKSNDDNWKNSFIRWCKVKQKSSTEQDIGEQVYITNTCEFEFRYDLQTKTISGTNRIEYNGKFYGVADAINVDERNETIRVTGVELG